MNLLKLKWQTIGDKKSTITCKATGNRTDYTVTIQVGQIPLASTIHIDMLQADALREMLEEVHVAFVNQSRSTGEQVKKHELSKMRAQGE